MIKQTPKRRMSLTPNNNIKSSSATTTTMTSTTPATGTSQVTPTSANKKTPTNTTRNKKTKKNDNVAVTTTDTPNSTGAVTSLRSTASTSTAIADSNKSNSSSINTTAVKAATATGTTTTVASASDFMVGMMIGEGSFGTIVYGKHKYSNVDVAIKVIEKVSLLKNHSIALRVKQEQMILKQLKNNNSYVIDLLASFHDKECVYLVMECCTGGTLLNVIQMIHDNNNTIQQQQQKQYSIQQIHDTICHYTYQLINGISYIHQNNIIHCDIKPDNILLTSNGMIKIADFGCAVDLSKPSASTPPSLSSSLQSTTTTNQQQMTRGTIGYVCPELILSSSSSPSSSQNNSMISPAVDLWSFGCICYQFITGHITSPFYHTDGELSSIKLLSDYCQIVSSITTINTMSSSTSSTSLFPANQQLLFPDSISLLVLDSNLNNMTTKPYTLRWKHMITTLLDPVPNKRCAIMTTDRNIKQETGTDQSKSGTVSSSSKYDPFHIWDDIDLSIPPTLLPPTPTWWKLVQQQQLPNHPDHDKNKDNTNPPPMKDGKLGWSAFLLSD